MKKDEVTSSRLVEAFRQHLAAQREALAFREAKRDELQARRDYLLHTPLAKEDVKQFIFDYIDARAYEFLTLGGLPAMFGRVAYPARDGVLPPHRRGIGKPDALSLADVDSALSGSDGIFGWSLPKFFTADNAFGPLTDLAAYFYFGDTMKAKIAEHFGRLYPGLIEATETTIGPPIAERRQEIAEIDVRLAALNGEIELIEAEILSLTAAPIDPKQETREAQAKEDLRNRERNRQIVRRCNGRNHEELAREFRISVREVQAIVNSPAVVLGTVH